MLAPGARVLVLSEDAATPAAVAGLLVDAGYGASAMTVLARLGAPDERTERGTARDWVHPPGDPLNVVAVACVADPGAPVRAEVPGLPDDAYDHDGQLTKREVRAVTLAHLGPRPGELLWDVGAGNGSIAIEWLRAHRTCRAVAVESDAARAARIAANADALGVPSLRVVRGRAPDALAGLPTPDAVFIGGGITTPGVLDACWAALRPGGRLVANAVTLEAEALVLAGRAAHGGDLTRIEGRARAPLGGFTGWRPAMPVTIWAVASPRTAAAPGAAPRTGRRSAMTVHFIGAGPGAVDLLTLRARDLIAASPVCLYAGTYVPPEMLDLCPAGRAEGRHRAPDARRDRRRRWSPPTRQGLDVARLASGDLSVFSRARRADAAAGRRGRAVRPVPRCARLRRGRRGAGAGADRADGGPDGHLDENRRAWRPPCRTARAWRSWAAPAARWCCTCRCTGSTRWSPQLKGVYGADCPAAVVAHATHPHEWCSAAGSTLCPPRSTRPASGWPPS